MTLGRTGGAARPEVVRERLLRRAARRDLREGADGGGGLLSGADAQLDRQVVEGPVAVAGERGGDAEAARPDGGGGLPRPAPARPRAPAVTQAVRSAWPKVGSASRSARRTAALSKEGGAADGASGPPQTTAVAGSSLPRPSSAAR